MPPSSVPRISTDDVDRIVALQFGVAWAGERREGEGLGWWESNLVSDDGGLDLFSRLTPRTARWAAWESVRRVALRTDLDHRLQQRDPDTVRSIFHLGHEGDALVNARIARLKQMPESPEVLLRRQGLVVERFDRAEFSRWVQTGVPTPVFEQGPAARIVVDDSRRNVERVALLAAALIPLAARYPFPMMRGR